MTKDNVSRQNSDSDIKAKNWRQRMVVWHILQQFEDKKEVHFWSILPELQRTQKSQTVLRSPHHMHQLTREMAGDEGSAIIIVIRLF